MKSKNSNLIVSITDNLGGAELLLFRISKYLASENNCENKIVICFLSSMNNTNWTFTDFANLEVKYFDYNIFKFIRYIFLNNFNLTFSSHIKVNSILGILRFFKILKTKKLIVRESTSIFLRYNGLKKLYYKILYILGYPKVDLVICQSSLMLESIKENIPINIIRNKSIVLFNPVEKYIYNDSQVKIGISNYIVVAGRLIPEKGFDILIKSFKILNVKIPELKLLVLGEGIERDNLETLISENNLNNKVLLLGYVENVYPYFKNAKACIVSSRIEGFPNVLLQMMSQNNNVVSTLCAGGIEEIKGIYTCKTNDVEDLYKSIFKAITTDNTHNRILFDNYLSERTIDKFMEKVYEQLYASND